MQTRHLGSRVAAQTKPHQKYLAHRTARPRQHRLQILANTLRTHILYQRSPVTRIVVSYILGLMQLTQRRYKVHSLRQVRSVTVRKHHQRFQTLTLLIHMHQGDTHRL
jgi:hypothetical protein